MPNENTSIAYIFVNFIPQSEIYLRGQLYSILVFLHLGAVEQIKLHQQVEASLLMLP